MRGRLVSLIIVIVLAVAPLARAMCEVSCVEGIQHSDAAAHLHHTPSTAGHDHHSVKHDSNREAIAAAFHHAPEVSASSCCADAETRLTSIAATRPGSEAPAVSTVFFTIVDHRARDVSTVTIRSAASAASPPSLNTPLRV